MFEEEPLDRFRHRALALASRMRFDPFLVNEAIAILTCSLEMEWVIDQAVTHRRGVPLPFLNHPVGEMVHIAGENQAAAALELAQYLKKVSNSRAFATVVAGIKAQYRQTLLQLAFHYRIALIADGQPILEPPVDDGRMADIQFQRSNQIYVVECYAPGVRNRTLDEVQWLTSQTMKPIRELEGILSIGIQLHSLPTAAERKELVRQITNIAKRLDRVDWRGDGPPPTEIIASDFACVSVSRTIAGRPGGQAHAVLHPSFPNLGRPDQLSIFKQVPRSEVTQLDLTAIQAAPLDHVAVWLPDEHSGLPDVIDEQVHQLVPKLKRKLAQIRSKNAYRILIVDTWTAGSRFRLSEDAQAKVEQALFGVHSNVAGVLLVTRHFDKEIKRHRYQIRPLVNIELGGSPIVDLVEVETKLTVPEVLA